MVGSALARGALAVASILAAFWIFGGSAQAQQRVDCGNGYHCPAGNACLLDGLCAVLVDALPGSTEGPNGMWCEPGFRVGKVRTDRCIPNDYTECPNGFSCAPGYQCAEGGGCSGGPPPTGPMCGGQQCAAGRICSSRNTCMNPVYFKDCGNGTICTKGAACEYPSGCALVGSARTRQVPNR